MRVDREWKGYGETHPTLEKNRAEAHHRRYHCGIGEIKVQAQDALGTVRSVIAAENRGVPQEIAHPAMDGVEPVGKAGERDPSFEIHP